MDDLDRLYHRLADAVRDGAPHLRERRFRLGDIPQHLLPYRLHRRELGFDGVAQYERALARLAAGERGYLSADAAVQQAFRRAVDDGAAGPAPASPHDSAVAQALRAHGDALVAFAPAGRTAEAVPASEGAESGLEIRIARATPGDAAPAVPAPSREAPLPSAPAAPPPPPSAVEDAMPFPVRPPEPVHGGACPHCGQALPAERGVTFCPYCGENLTVRRCPACSTELETGWRFCITCGREVDEPAGPGAPAAGLPAAGDRA